MLKSEWVKLGKLKVEPSKSGKLKIELSELSATKGYYLMGTLQRLSSSIKRGIHFKDTFLSTGDIRPLYHNILVVVMVLSHDKRVLRNGEPFHISVEISIQVSPTFWGKGVGLPDTLIITFIIRHVGRMERFSPNLTLSYYVWVRARRLPFAI